LSFLCIENKTKILKSFGKEEEVGIPLLAVWERLMFLISLHGKAPLSGLCRTIRYDGNTLTFTDEYSKIGEIEFEHCYYFGDRGCTHLTQETRGATKYICYDWIAFKIGGKHAIDYIETRDRFVRKIWFYPSDRLGNYITKDACVLSILHEHELHEFDFGSTMARFKTVHEMKKRGMKARVAGYDKNRVPNKWKKYRTSYIARTVRKADSIIKTSIKNVTLMHQKLLTPEDIRTDIEIYKTLEKLKK
jgi:hypothetical protein